VLARRNGGLMHEKDVLGDANASEWLRTALRTALECDPVTAANEAERLVRVLRLRVVRLAQVEAMVLAGKAGPEVAEPLRVRSPEPAKS
jgi:hypothetical protein